LAGGNVIDEATGWKSRLRAALPGWWFRGCAHTSGFPRQEEHRSIPRRVRTAGSFSEPSYRRCRRIAAVQRRSSV